VEREEEIKNFKPVKYWQITLVAEKDGIFIKVPFEERFLAKEIAESVLRGVDEYITVESFKRYTVKEERPSPFNTTEFLREASRFFSPEKAMEIAERLYMKGYISYPRTDNTVYPRTLNLASILKALESVDVFRKHVREILSGRIEPSRGKKETKDHPPIHPVAPASRSLLSREEWIIYELVCRRFLATLSKPCIWEVREAVLSCGKLKTKLKGKVILSPGWRSVYTYSKAEEVKIPELSEGEKLRVVRKIVEEKETKPPKRYSEGEIIKIMERLNLGTKATRHEILKKLKERRYVVGNPLRPTEDAYTILDTLKKIAEEITLPDMTAELERKMDLIEEGKLKEHEVVMESSKKLKELISKHVNNLPHNIQR
jgi:DNA topoisomerase-1